MYRMRTAFGSLPFVFLCRKNRALRRVSRGTTMTDFSALRRTMVDGQVRTSDVTDLRLIAAMLDLPRERFVPQDGKMEFAYLDLDIPVSAAGRPLRRMLKPMVLAKLIQAANVGESDRVLDIGCATGYSSALLGRLAGAVVALEQDAELAQFAKKALASLGAANVTVAIGPLMAGWPAAGPFDVIVLEGASEVVPECLHAQLKEGGRLVCVLGRGPGKAMLYRSVGGEFSGRPIFDATAPLLPGFAQTPEFVF
jgi:protein-L-isoaspartate(D-aspartate) O-methyltransferase